MRMALAGPCKLHPIVLRRLPMLVRHSPFPLLLTILFLLPCDGRGSSEALDAAQVLQHLQESVGPVPWNPDTGYRLRGRFTLKSTGDEISYAATYLRLPDRWVADFTRPDRTGNMRYGFGPQPWASSPEYTAEIPPEQLPFCARYDFLILYADLLRILREGKGDPGFLLESDGSQVYVRGSLHGGSQATFLLTTTEYLPRKVSIKSPPPASPGWLFTTLEPSGHASLIRLPAGGGDRFEVWFSQPVPAARFRYPRRTDYVSDSGVIATFLFEEGGEVQESDALFDRPPVLPWSKTLAAPPQSKWPRPSWQLGEGELQAFRLKLDSPPWSGWRRTNAVAAAWGCFAVWLGALFPGPVSPISLATLSGFMLVGFFVLLRRRRAVNRRIPRPLLPAGALSLLTILLLGTASIQLQSPQSRSLIALHLAIRHAVTGNTFYAGTAERLLHKLATAESRPDSASGLARACQAYSLAYDLVAPVLPQESRATIEKDLFHYAKSLYGALQGWRANTGAVAGLSSGLGMVGLATGCDLYVDAARSGIEKSLENHLTEGLHGDGPGPGSVALDDGVNLFYALKRAGRGDYYVHPAFQEYVRTTLQLLSPVGTLPLFGASSLDQAAHTIPFLLKVAVHLPADLGRQCVAAYDSYWEHGRYEGRGLRKIMAAMFRRQLFFYDNPYVLLHYERALPPGSAAGWSEVLGSGQAAVLRCGRGADAVYLALNTLRSPPNQPYRDILSFDLYACNGLLLHGPGFPGAGHAASEKACQSAAANTLTFDGRGQSGTRCTGINFAMLNQPVFDHVRALGDGLYDQGQVQRDVIMVRPDRDHPPYFLLIDEVHVLDPGTRVAWFLHGRGTLKTGMDRVSTWTCSSFSPPSLRTSDVFLAAYSIGAPGTVQSAPGKLYFENSLLTQDSEALALEWTGSRRLCTVLFPGRSKSPEPAIEALSDAGSCRVGTTDWISLGDLQTCRTAGPIRYLAEYVVVREREKGFPALLMMFGLEFQTGSYSLASSEPVSLSLDGLQGGLWNTRPETRLELRSPEIQPGDTFRLDGLPVAVTRPGLLALTLSRTGSHLLQRAPPGQAGSKRQE